jgi:alcohol dehydrogenase
MKAWVINEYGDNSKVHQINMEQPKIGPNDILIQIKAASINPVDYKIRNGDLKDIMPYEFPLILGHDCSGVVSKIGQDVSRFKVGDEVYTRSEIGTLAEFVCANEADVAIKPKNISFEEAASIPLVGLTSWQALFEEGKIKSGNKVFIPAGSGGVGTFAVQLAKHYGAYVATNTSGSNVHFVSSLGADKVYNYEEDEFQKHLEDFDVVFDTMGGDTQAHSFDILKEKGKLISIVGPPNPGFVLDNALGAKMLAGSIALSFKNIVKSQMSNKQYKFFLMHPDGKTLEKIAELIEAENIKPVIDKIFSFEDASSAIAYTEKGHNLGKVVVSMEQLH